MTVCSLYVKSLQYPSCYAWYYITFVPLDLILCFIFHISNDFKIHIYQWYIARALHLPLLFSALHFFLFQNEQVIMTCHLCFSRVFMSDICFHITISEATISDERVSQCCVIKLNHLFQTAWFCMCCCCFIGIISLKVRADVFGFKDIFLKG